MSARRPLPDGITRVQAYHDATCGVTFVSAGGAWLAVCGAQAYSIRPGRVRNKVQALREAWAKLIGDSIMASVRALHPWAIPGVIHYGSPTTRCKIDDVPYRSYTFDHANVTCVMCLAVLAEDISLAVAKARSGEVDAARSRVSAERTIEALAPTKQGR